MDLEIIVLSEVSQTEKDKYQIRSLTCGIKKVIQTLINRTTHKHRKQTYSDQRRKEKGEIN